MLPVIDMLRRDGSTYKNCLYDGGSDSIRSDETKRYTEDVLSIYSKVQSWVSKMVPLRSDDEFALLQGHVFYAMTAFAMKFFLLTYSNHVTAYPIVPKEYALPYKFDGLSNTEVDENKELLLELVQQWDAEITDFFYQLPQNEPDWSRHLAYNRRLEQFKQACVTDSRRLVTEKGLNNNVVYVFVVLMNDCIEGVNVIGSDVINEANKQVSYSSESCLKCLKQC